MGPPFAICRLKIGITLPDEPSTFLYVTSDTNESIGKISSSGTLLDQFTVSGLTSPAFIAVSSLSAIPEPAACAVGFGLAAILTALWRKRGRMV